MQSAKWAVMKQMKRLTKKRVIKITLQSLPIVILAAIAFISVPSFLPENTDGMQQSVAVIEYKSQLVITSKGKVVAAVGEIMPDSTMKDVKERADKNTVKRQTSLGCWINKWSFVPSCPGLIISVSPQSEQEETLASYDADTLIDRTILRSKEMIKVYKQRKTELDYYLKTHSVKDEGYSFIAEYSEEYANLSNNLGKQLKLLMELKQMEGLHLYIRTSYSLLYSTDGKKSQSIPCTVVKGTREKYAKQIVLLQTKDRFMPKNANAVYRFNIMNVAPECNDTITIATIFGLNFWGSQKPMIQKVSTFEGIMKDSCNHNIPQLLAPNGAPVFNDKGFFIGLNFNGRII